MLWAPLVPSKCARMVCGATSVPLPGDTKKHLWSAGRMHILPTVPSQEELHSQTLLFRFRTTQQCSTVPIRVSTCLIAPAVLDSSSHETATRAWLGLIASAAPICHQCSAKMALCDSGMATWTQRAGWRSASTVPGGPCVASGLARQTHP